MSLGTPWMLLLLPLVALVGWLMTRARRLQLEAAGRLQGAVPGNTPVGLGRRGWLSLAALAAAVLALARPQWNPRPYQVERRGRDLVMVLDVSRSMLAADVFPSRLEAARIAILEALPALTGQRIALITFAGSASVRVPLTLDHGFVRYMLERADPSNEDLGSTSLQAPFEKATSTVLTDTKGGRRDLVMFTDGEDHLSDIEPTAELLATCGARVLIIGLGDPVRGARVPAVSATDQWMRYRNSEVLSRLEEDTLAKLAAASPHVTYYPARTHPFDLVPLYQDMISQASDDVVVGQLRQVRYTEGYPYLLGLSGALWLMASPLRLPAPRTLLLIVLLLPGCRAKTHEGSEPEFRARFERGGELLQFAQEQAPTDSVAHRSLLLDAREEFLRAALLRPGDLETARRITAITRRLRELAAIIDRQRAEEEKRNEELTKIITRLEKSTVRQTRLSQQSQQILRRLPVPPKREMNRLARPASAEQQIVRKETARTLDSIKFQQNALRLLLTRAYGDIGRPHATELDPIVDLLAQAVTAQQQALASLMPASVRWPEVNTTFHTAAGKMQQALEALRNQQPPSKDEKDSAMPSQNDSDYDEDLDGSDSESQGQQSQRVPGGEFDTAVTLPVPNYSSAEILAEESANQQKRIQRRAARAGAEVEKNW